MGSGGPNGYVRRELQPATRKRQAFDEWVFARFPSVLRAGMRRTFELPLHSRIRQALVRRNIRLSYAAQNRGDWRIVTAPYGPDSELRNVPIEGGGAAVAVVKDTYRGREGAVQLLEDWVEPFDRVRFEPQEYVDVGDGRLLVLSYITGAGKVSGVEIREKLGQLIVIRDGGIVQQRNWLGSWREALEAVDLRE